MFVKVGGGGSSSAILCMVGSADFLRRERDRLCFGFSGDTSTGLDVIGFDSAALSLDLVVSSFLS